jgi:hypothetical protein
MARARTGDDDRRELANRLFAIATAMLEDATEIAAAGQSARLGARRLAAHGRRLEAAAREVAVLAEAATIVANLSADRRPTPRKRLR